jgi:Zn-dependent protease with chaperone function
MKEMLTCYRCGQSISDDEARPVAMPAFRPRPRWRKVPFCRDCHRSYMGRLADTTSFKQRLPILLPLLIFFIANATAIWTRNPAVAKAVGAVSLVVGIPAFALLAWRMKRVLRPEIPYARDYAPPSELRQRLNRPIPAWAVIPVAIVAMGLLTVLTYALAGVLLWILP